MPTLWTKHFQLTFARFAVQKLGFDQILFSLLKFYVHLKIKYIAIFTLTFNLFHFKYKNLNIIHKTRSKHNKNVEYNIVVTKPAYYMFLI